MSRNDQKIPRKMGLFALIIVILLFNIACMIGIKLSGRTAMLELRLYDSVMNVIVSDDIEMYIDNSPYGGGMLMLGFLALQNVIACIVVSLFSLWVMDHIRSFMFRKTVISKQLNNESILPIGYPHEISVVPPRPVSEGIPYKKIDFPFAERYVRLSRKKIIGASPTTPYQRLEIALGEILRAYPDTPACIVGYHSDATLYDHSRLVASRMMENMALDSEFDPVALSLALAHDIEKILVYKRKKKGDDWEAEASHYHQYAVTIIASLIEFKCLDEDDRTALCFALAYYHHPSDLPRTATQRHRNLIKWLKGADGSATNDEQKEGLQSLEAKAEADTKHIFNALINVIQRIDINGYLATLHPEGWTTAAYPFVAIPEKNIRKHLQDFLPIDLARRLQITTNYKGRKHPATGHIIESLKKMGLLMSDYKDMTTSNGMWFVKSGSIGFSHTLFLSKEAIEKRVPGLIDKWGKNRYALKVQGPHEEHDAE
ncbi:MAG: hypothetical protein V3T17_16440 [Pseudomonadales bacterium]